MSRDKLSLFDRKLLVPALLETFRKLDPRVQWRNPVMFVVYIGTIVTFALYVQALGGHGEASPGFTRAIARAHGGSLEVDSSDDATTFQLVLPRYTARAAAPA